MAYDRQIRGSFSDLSVAAESVLVQGAVDGVDVHDGGIVLIQGAVAGSALVVAGGTLHIAGVFSGELTIERDGQAILQGVLRGSVTNRGGLIIDATEIGSSLSVTGDGKVLPWDELSEETKAMLPRVETKTKTT